MGSAIAWSLVVARVDSPDMYFPVSEFKNWT